MPYTTFYHCKGVAKCYIPMLLLHTFSMMGDYVVGAYNNDTRVLLQGGSKMHYPLLLKAVHTNSNHRSIKDIMHIGGYVRYGRNLEGY